MKTAKEWLSLMLGLSNPALLTVNQMAIREIQLDAIREGMRRAADKLDVAYYQGNASASALSHRDAILTAAKQLSIQDL